VLVGRLSLVIKSAKHPGSEQAVKLGVLDTRKNFWKLETVLPISIVSSRHVLGLVGEKNAKAWSSVGGITEKTTE